MRIRLAVVIVLVLVAAAACTSGSKSRGHSTGSSTASTGGASTSAKPSVRVSTGPSKKPTPYCNQLLAAAPKINAAQTALYAGTSSDTALDNLTAELTGLQSGAPGDLKAALADMVVQFRAARDILQRPTMQDRDRIAEFGRKISDDNRVLAAYVNAHCPTG